MIFEKDALWQYQATANEVPPDPAAVVVPADSWLGPSQAPFGNEPRDDEVPNTDWPAGEGLWIRRALVADGVHDVRLSGRIENACFVYLDGEYIGAFNPTNVQRDDNPSWAIMIDKARATAGSHELALLCLDEVGMEETSFTYVYAEADALQPVFPFWPSTPLTETLEWVTDVQISDNGTEDRAQVRVVPRQTLRMEHYIPTPYLRLAANLTYARRDQQWLVPIWPFVQGIGAVEAGLFELEVPTASVDFRDASLVMIWQAPDRYQVVSVDEVGNGSLSLIGPTQAFDDAYVVPLLPGFVPQAPDRSFNGRKARFSMTFVIEDNVDLTPAAPTQYQGDDIYFVAGLLDGDSLTESVTAEFSLLDNTIGAVDYFQPWLHNRIARPHRITADGLAEGWAMRQWLYRRAGRFRPFWQPSFESDLRCVSTGALAALISVSSDEYMRFAQDRGHIAVETDAGWMARQVIAAVQVDQETVQLTLDSALGINASAIRRISFLGLKRLDTDRVEIEWIGGAVSRTAVSTLEIEP